jgi:hypothetical protein
MRDVRNRIVHDYLPEDIKEIYDSIMGPFGKQLLKVKEKINTWRRKKGQARSASRTCGRVSCTCRKVPCRYGKIFCVFRVFCGPLFFEILLLFFF